MYLFCIHRAWEGIGCAVPNMVLVLQVDGTASKQGVLQGHTASAWQLQPSGIHSQQYASITTQRKLKHKHSTV